MLAMTVAGVAVLRCCTASEVHSGFRLVAPLPQHDVRRPEGETAKGRLHDLEERFCVGHVRWSGLLTATR